MQVHCSIPEGEYFSLIELLHLLPHFKEFFGFFHLPPARAVANNPARIISWTPAISFLANDERKEAMFVINIDVGSRRCHSKRFGEWVKSYSRSLERLQMETNVNDTKNLLHTSFRRREMSATDGERRKEKRGGGGKVVAR